MSEDTPETELLGQFHAETARRIAAMPDDELSKLVLVAHEAIDRAEAYAGKEAHHCVLRLLSPLLCEPERRRELEDNARVAVEANGHEVFLSYDEGFEDDGWREGWNVGCTCILGTREDDYLAFCPTYTEAVQVGGEHAAEHGGRWG